MLSVRAATFELLRARGIRTVFGNPGSTELGFLADFPSDFRYVLGLHESVVVGMADGFAQMTGRPSFVNLHSACGVGNAMGAVVNAFHNRAPIVITAGNQDRRHLESEPYLFARATELMEPYVKSSRQTARAEDVPAAIDRAWQLAQTPPAGPVFVSVPTDDWAAEVETLPAREPMRAGRQLDVTDIAARVRAASRPAIVAGAGVDRDDAWRGVVELAERLAAPVWAAPQAPRAGFPEDHRLFQGHLAPGYATAAAQLAGRDLVLVLGAPVFSFLPYEPGAVELPPVVQVTDDPEEAARAPATLSLIGDVGSAVQGLRAELPGRAQDGDTVAARSPAAIPDPSEPIPPGYLMATLGRLLDPNTVVVEESPSNRGDFRRHVRIRRPRSFFTTASGGLGFAMPAALGIKLAEPSRRVVCVVGDGSALYVPQSLWSAVQLGLAITFVIVNNGRYAILDAAARFSGLEDVPGLELPGIDFVSLARSLGCPAERVAAPGELHDALAGALGDDRPRLIDVAVAPAPPPLLPSVSHQTGGSVPHQPPERLVLDHAEIGRTLDDLAAIGNRYAGTPGETVARDYLLERFQALGLDDVRLEPFTYLGYRAEAASCLAVGPGLEFECHPLQYTATGEVAGEAIYLGEAAEADFERIDARGVDLAGRIAVIHSMFPFDLVGILTERGIAGLVHVCETPDGIVGNFTGALYPPPLAAPWEGRPTAYPGVTISHPAGRALISELSCGRPVEIRLSHAGGHRERIAHNVVGAIPGGEPGEVILSAHYDSQAEGPCVFDNGSGLASLLEAARVLRGARRRRTIILLASACEEIGVWGASAYVHAHARELEDAVAMINLDGIASAYPSHREIWCADAALLELAARTAGAQGWEPDRMMHARSTFSDHAPFTDAGVPACLIWRPDYPYYHSRGDVRSLVDERAIAQTASVSAALARRLATDPAALPPRLAMT